MTDAVRVLLTAVVLTGTAAGTYAVYVTGTEPGSHARIVGQLRIASATAMLLAAAGAINVGLAIASQAIPQASLDVAIGAMVVAFAAFTQSRAPREGLSLTACGFLAHALMELGHRPGFLAEIAPKTFVVGSAACDLYLAAVCYWARRT